MNNIVWDLYKHYINMTPSADKISHIENQMFVDHLALRTFNYGKCSIDNLVQPLLEEGYEKRGTYSFEDKHLDAHHYELEGKIRVFVSELRVDELSTENREIVYRLTKGKEAELLSRPWTASLNEYLSLAEESEYAAWLTAHGWIANHFAMLINDNIRDYDIENFNYNIESYGFTMNTSGGSAVKGSKDVLLEQSSTMADKVIMNFSDGWKYIPGCFCEFAYRHIDPETGELFSGFVRDNANTIFDSTNRSSNGS